MPLRECRPSAGRQVSPGHSIGPYPRSVTSVEKELRNLRQLAWSMIPGGMSLVAASFFGSSWYLAERIRSEALAVGPGPAMPAYDDVQFVAVSPEQVQLPRSPHLSFTAMTTPGCRSRLASG